MVNRLLTKCKVFDDILSGNWLPRVCAYATSSRALLSACQDLLAAAAFSPLPPADDASTAAALSAIHASQTPVTVGSSRGMLRGALHAGLSAGLNAGQSAVASLSGLFSGALPAALDRLSTAGPATRDNTGAAYSAAADSFAAPPAAAGVDTAASGSAGAALLLQPQQQNLGALAAVCGAEAAQAVGSSAVASLTAARSDLRLGRITTPADAAKGAAQAVEAVQDGLQRLSVGLDRSGFQAAVRSVAKKLDDAISGELMEAAQAGGVESVPEVVGALAEVCPLRLLCISPRPLANQLLQKSAESVHQNV